MPPPCQPLPLKLKDNKEYQEEIANIQIKADIKTLSIYPWANCLTLTSGSLLVDMPGNRRRSSRLCDKGSYLRENRGF